MKKRIGEIFLLILGLLFVGFFVFFFFNCIKYQSVYNELTYDDLKYKELTFEKYEKIAGRRHRNVRYLIYFDEYDEPFEIIGVVVNKIDKTALDDLSKNQTLEVYYFVDSSAKYEYEICELKFGSTKILSLSDYKEANVRNQTLGIIICPIFVLIGLFLLWIYICWLYNDDMSIKLIKEGKYSTINGKVEIEYKIGNDVIQFCKYLDVYTLVINGNVVHKSVGFLFERFCLRGFIKIDNQRTSVEILKGYFITKLQIGKDVVSKKIVL